MYAGKDFTSFNSPEVEVLGFDFAQTLSAGDSLAAVAFSMVAIPGDTTDPNPDHRIGGGQIQGTLVLQKVGGLLVNCVYGLVATVTTTNGETLVLWARIVCVPYPREPD